MTYPEFEARGWQNSGGAERANYGLFLQDLCHLLGVPAPDPTTDDPTQDAYVLERAVTFDDGAGRRSTGRIDLYRRGCFVLETKQGTDTPDAQQRAERAELGLAPAQRRTGHAVRNTRKWEQMMEAARQQALRYVRALPANEPRPPFVVVADVGYCIDLYSNFAGVGDTYIPFPDPATFRIPLAQLADPEVRARLALLFTDPQQLDPARRAAQVTRRLAAQLAALSAQLERAGHSSEVVAQFLMRCLFTMFAEDVELIPRASFGGLLAQYAATPALREMLPDALQSLWQRMDTGGFSPELQTRLRRFNGRLFHDANALPLTADQLTLLQAAAAADWTAVEPAIFGTLLERALDPRERHSLGAHYTPRRYVERLVLPTVIEPLRREWAAAQAASAQRQNEGDDGAARTEIQRFLTRLTTVRILDPACGSGNFLYVTLEHLKRLEAEVLATLGRFGVSGLLELGAGTTVSPHQLLGLELNPRAANIADVVLRIGYLQWHLRTHGLTQLAEPLLDNYQNIRQQDAVLAHGPAVPRLDAAGQPVTRWDGTTRPHPVTGLPMPDETARAVVLDYPNPRPAEWPQADFIVGNPPFIGAKYVREALGDGYAESLRAAYKGKVPESADLVMYWWHNAAETVRAGHTERFGFITTNSISQPFNRRIMQPFLEGDTPPLALTFAIPDHPWVEGGDGAAVRIAMTVAEPNDFAPGQLLTVRTEAVPEGEDAADVTFTEQQGRILPDLSIGADFDSAQPLKANVGVANRGVQLMGSGFIVEPEKAKQLGFGQIPDLSNHIRAYRNGKDLTDKPRGVLVIDLFGLKDAEVLSKFPAVYQHVLETVKPERDQNNRASYRLNWWIFGEARSSFRPALQGISRYVATAVTAKHRLFQFLPVDTLPDDALIAIATDDAYHLGILSSRFHVTWALAVGTDLGGNTPRYIKGRCFDPFPFPAATPVQQTRIRELAEQLDSHRKRQQAQHPALTLTDLYNVVEKLRAGQPLTPKEQATNERGLASIVLSLHQQLDAAVAAAYGWPTDLPDAELLTRLVALNHERQREEQAGTVRYLRPAYQAPGQQQAALALPTTGPATTAATETAGPQPWPAELAQQMQAVRAVVAQAAAPVTAAQVAARFRRTRATQVQPLLATLAALSLLRHLEPEDAYAA